MSLECILLWYKLCYIIAYKLTQNSKYILDVIFQQLLGGHEVYHYHGKLVQKNPNTGGTFLWHQDYGYVLITIYFDINCQIFFVGFQGGRR